MRTGSAFAATLLAVALCAIPATRGDAAVADKAVCTKPQSMETQPGAKHPVILVHGWNGGPQNLDPVKSVIAAKLGERAVAYSFDYHLHSDHWAGNQLIAGCLAVFVDALATASRAGGGTGKVFLVTHSMGGLAARYASAMTVDGRQVGAEMAGVITLDTPHRGSLWGGTGYARLMAETLGSVTREWAPLPDVASDAARCLARHNGADSFPVECGPPPPYYPESTPLLQISGDVSINRTLLGFSLYTFRLGGDSVVDSASETGYIASGRDRPAKYGPVAAHNVACTVEAGQLLYRAFPANQRLAALVAEATADILIDSAVLDDILAGRVGNALAAMLIVANIVGGCSHARIVSDTEAQDVTVRQLTAWINATRPQCPTATEFAATAARLYFEQDGSRKATFDSSQLSSFSPGVTCEGDWATASVFLRDRADGGGDLAFLLHYSNGRWQAAKAVASAGIYSGFAQAGFSCSAVPDRVRSTFRGCLD